MKFIILLSLIILSNSYNAQDVLGRYPLNQHPYIGGQVALDKDLVAVFKDLGLTDCPTEQEYVMSVLVEADSSIKFIKDFDSINVDKNKCAFDIGKKVIPNLKRWLAASIDGKFYPAIAKIVISPLVLSNSKDNPKDNVTVNPTIKGGIDAFSKIVYNIFYNLPEVDFAERSSISFIVDATGKMKDIVVLGNHSPKEKKDIIRDLERLKLKWIPGSFNGIPKSFRMMQYVTKTPRPAY